MSARATLHDDGGGAEGDGVGEIRFCEKDRGWREEHTGVVLTVTTAMAAWTAGRERLMMLGTRSSGERSEVGRMVALVRRGCISISDSRGSRENYICSARTRRGAGESEQGRSAAGIVRIKGRHPPPPRIRLSRRI